MNARKLSFVLVALVALGVTWGLFEAGGRSPVAEHPVTVPETLRTVAVSATMPSPSAHERRLSAMLEDGDMPHRSMMAEVLTDTDCAPDGQMVSRCRNEVRLSDGSTIVLRHPHDMRTIPCLAPGERVLVAPAAA